MKVTFIGVGEINSTKYPNTSVLVESKKGNMLLDCGTSAFQPVLKLINEKDPEFLDGIYVSNVSFGSLVV
jgi:ribonuclease BN (tRNA processing enzyme)